MSLNHFQIKIPRNNLKQR